MRDADYRELVAKKMLEAKFPEKFSELKKSESPDWHNANVGLEVRRAIIGDEAKFLAMHKKYSNSFKKDIPEKLLSSLGFDDNLVKTADYPPTYLQHSEKVGTIMYFWYEKEQDYRLMGVISKMETSESTESNIVEAINDKLAKLNDHYVPYAENDLILLLDEFVNFGVFEEEIENDIIANIKSCYKNTQYSSVFDNLYLLFNDLLMSINTNTWEYVSMPLSQADWDLIR